MKTLSISVLALLILLFNPVSTSMGLAVWMDEPPLFAPNIRVSAASNEGQIVFVSCRNYVKNLVASDCGLSIMNADGSGLRPLTDGVDDKNPALSPDGKKVAFSSQRRDGNYEIYVINTDGTNLTRLTNREETDISPDWSPDGKKIAFAGPVEGGDPYKYFIFSMNADGSDVKQLINSYGISPEWFSDAELIYISLHNNVGDIMKKMSPGKVLERRVSKWWRQCR